MPLLFLAPVAVMFLGAAAASPAHAYTPAVDYALNCQGCHRADGAETPGSVPPLAGSVARFLAVPGGREYLVQVPGVSQAPLDDAPLAALLNWMLERFDAAHMPKPFVPYSAEEIGRLRKSPLTDVEGLRRKLLDAVERHARGAGGG
jgi:mono/diheme cytochrome c family protein